MFSMPFLCAILFVYKALLYLSLQNNEDITLHSASWFCTLVQWPGWTLATPDTFQDATPPQLSSYASSEQLQSAKVKGETALY